MLIFLYGQDTYRSHQKLEEIINHYKKIHKSGLNLRYLDLKEQNYQDFRDNFQIRSMLKEKKLIILKNAFFSQDFKEKFIKDIKKIRELDDIVVFYEDGEIAKNDSLFNLLKKEGRCQEFRELDSSKLRNWAKKEFNKYKVEIEPRALELLISYTGSDLWHLSNEINKLINYTKHISMTAVSEICKGKIETDIFKTIDAIAVKNRKQALSLIHRHLEKGDSPLYIFSMIAFQFRNLLTIKGFIEKNHLNYKLPKIPGLHPYIIKKSLSQVKKFSFDELKKIYQRLFEVDLDIKTGKIDPQIALDLLIAEI